MKVELKRGFTLIELIIVIAILAFVTVVGIHNYGNVREVQAKKVNLANIKRVYHALATYETLQREQASTSYFNYFDSLIDVGDSGAWLGAPGDYKWTDVAVSGAPGVYDGSWKYLESVYNAAGQGSGAVPTKEAAQEENLGTRETGLLKSLGIYFLSTNDCNVLRNAGVRTYLLHNPSTAQATTHCPLPADVKTPGGGGPGFRPDMSAYYPADIEPGTPVAIVKPLSAGRGSAALSTVYTDFGYFDSSTNSWSTSDSDQARMISSLGVKLVVFGIGRGAECVRSQFGLGEAPYNPVYTKKHYRNYLAVFAIKPGGQGVASTCNLVGVLDCSGNTYKQAEYGVNWTTQLN